MRSLGKAWAFVIVVAFVASALVGTPTASATTASSGQRMSSTSLCHGYVYRLWKSKGYVHMKYWIYCHKRVDTIQNRSWLSDSTRRETAMSRKICHHAYMCAVTKRLKDKPGRQAYYAWPDVDIVDPVASLAYIENNGSWWACRFPNHYMRCDAEGKYF